MRVSGWLLYDSFFGGDGVGVGESIRRWGRRGIEEELLLEEQLHRQLLELSLLSHAAAGRFLLRFRDALLPAALSSKISAKTRPDSFDICSRKFARDMIVKVRCSMPSIMRPGVLAQPRDAVDRVMYAHKLTKTFPRG